MQKINVLAAILLFSSICQFVYASTPNSPVGDWKSIDDVSGQPKSIIHIEEDSDKQLIGRVTKLFQTNHTICTQCQGKNKNQPILGMTIMEGFKHRPHDDPTSWTNGSILDPKNGKIYHCNLQVMNAGQNLKVRGYIGMPLFGRTQTWIRLK